MAIPVSGTKLLSFSELLLREICFTFDIGGMYDLCEPAVVPHQNLPFTGK
jgi:hypothetical protein